MNKYEVTFTTESASDLRRMADALVEAVTGPPAFGVPIIFDLKGDPRMGEIRVKDDHAPLDATVKFLDAKGAETVEASSDGLSAMVTIGLPGESVISAETTETHEGVGDATVVRAVGTVIVETGDTTTGSVEFAETTGP